MTIKEIDRQICELRAKRQELEKVEREEFLKSAKNNIGRCFKVNGVYAKVLDVPQVKSCTTHIDFNKYQYPTIFLGGTDGYPFELDTLFSDAWGVGHNTLNVNYEEISKEEFNAEFDRRISKFVQMVKEK